MLKSKILAITVLILTFFALILFLIYKNYIWANNGWIRIFYAFILAVILGFFIEYSYRKIKPRDRITQNTQTVKPKKEFAKLILDEVNQCVIREYERNMGREDFLGVINANKLLFIGKKHFKIVKMDDGFYIEDLGTKNGTFLNGEDIRGLGKKKLKDGDLISIADVLELKFALNS